MTHNKNASRNSIRKKKQNATLRRKRCPCAGHTFAVGVLREIELYVKRIEARIEGHAGGRFR